MPLKIELKEKEKIIINGAVLEAGPGGMSFAVLNTCRFMYERDILQLEQATSPARFIYYWFQNFYIEAGDRDANLRELGKCISDYYETTRINDVKRTLEHISDDLTNEEYWKVLKRIKALIAFEDALLAETGFALDVK